MYKVMIVDDERLIREGLSCLIDWKSLGYSVEALAQDAVEAMQVFVTLSPDLVLMDIKMPGMDGLTLIQEMKKIKNDAHFIILSGYTDFEYAKQAIFLKIDAYLRKPVDEQELISCLLQIKKSLDEEPLPRTSRAVVGNGEARFNTESGNQALDSYLKAALTMGPGTDVHQHSCAQLEKALAWTSWQVFLIETRSKNEDSSGAGSVQAILEQDFGGRKAGVTVAVEAGIALVVHQEHVNQKLLVQLYRQIEMLLRPRGMDFFVSCGNPVHKVASLHESFAQARDRMKLRFFSAPGGIITQIPDRFGLGRTQGAREDMQSTVERLYLALHSGNENLVMQILDEAIESLIGTEEGENAIKSILVRLLSSAMNRLVSNNSAVWGNGEDRFDWISECYLKNSLSELRSYINENLMMVMEQDSGEGALGLVRKISDLVRKNYYKNLKLESLSEVFNYNSAYLGKLFKLHTGESFHTFLDKVRIEKAKELLSQGMKVYVVAERVGYAYVDYFHGKFRKYTGMSPSEFRKTLGNPEIESLED